MDTDYIVVELANRLLGEDWEAQFTGQVQAGDIIVGGFNFGTGSSREQAVTALQAAEIALVIAGSFSQTYLRNAFNNGFPCVESPDLLGRVGELLADRVEAGEKTIVPGDEIEIEHCVGGDDARDAARDLGDDVADRGGGADPAEQPVGEVLDRHRDADLAGIGATDQQLRQDLRRERPVGPRQRDPLQDLFDGLGMQFDAGNALP